MTDKINTSRKKLRTKTGCFTCRQRRKKCDEKTPICDLCRSSGRKCIWPSASDLLDRRYSHHSDSRHQDRSLKEQLSEPDDDGLSLIPSCSNQPLQHAPSPSSPSTIYEIDSVCPLDLLSQAATVHRVLSNHLELRVSDHFSDKYFSLLLLPDCYRGFHDGWLTEIKQLMVTHKSLYYSVLACAASHIFLTDSVWEMHPLALSYYAEGVKELQLLLGKVAQYENHDALLMSVMLLYLHGCLGWGTHSDVAKHVNAATRIVTLRLLDKPAGIQRLFDRLALESVIYQQFLLSTGLWSESSQSDFVFDPDFWDSVEKLLNRSSLLSGAPWNVESPVLGVPLYFFRTAIILRECYRSGVSLDPAVFSQIQQEVQCWEAQLCDPHSESIYTSTDTVRKIPSSKIRDETYLYALVASLLLEEISENGSRGTMPSVVSRDKWQIKLFLRILESHQGSREWARSYAGNWPAYTLGVFLSSPEDRLVVKKDLEASWEVTRMTYALRYCRDLDIIWKSRC
ncbi:hypothetical protein LB506_011442 [Fusarium annulatum]|nr:hypothetical protein LB506_011442 [Fusarium annulatum]